MRPSKFRSSFIARPWILSALLMVSFTTEVCAEKIRTAIPQANLNYLSIYVADAKGFFGDEGLENETVVISGPLATAALLSGDVDFSGGGGSGMRAALKGAPVKGIFFQTEKVTFYLIADPSIKTAADLKGKKVAVGSSGDTQDRMITMFAERGGVSSRDLTRIAMGSDTTAAFSRSSQARRTPARWIRVALCLRKKRDWFRWAFSVIFFPCPFRDLLLSIEKFAKTHGRSSAGSRQRFAGLCSCATNLRRQSTSALKSFN